MAAKLRLPDFARGWLPDWLVLIRRWHRAHGVLPRILRPSTFNEKVLHRMIFDRRPIFTELADKAAVRTRVLQRLGPDILPKLYHLTTRPADIPFDTLPDRFVVKPTHGSGWVWIVMDKAGLDRDALVRTCNDWLDLNYYDLTRERHYQLITPRILIEEFVGDSRTAPPDDYKLLVFNGVVKVIQLDRGRFGDHRRRLFTPAWERIDALWGYDDIIGDAPAPPHLTEMIGAAEALGAGLDFIRADFYDTAGGLYFGELTATPESGFLRFYPEAFDRWLGDCWTLAEG